MFKVLTLLCAVTGASQVALVAKNLPFHTGDIRYPSSIPGSGRSPGEGNGNPHQYSCLENPMDRGAWWATVPRVTQSQTRLKWFSTHAHAVVRKRIRSWSQVQQWKPWIPAPSQPNVEMKLLVETTQALSTQLWLQWPSSSASVHSWAPARRPTNSPQITDMHVERQTV